MIYRDQNGFLVNETLDGMDSTMRAGIMTVFGNEESHLFKYVDPVLTPVRHPFHEPSNNPKNFTRDQLIPLMAGLYKLGDTYYSRKIFWKLFRRGFFCFNSERDWPGSTKYPWSHYFYKDSFPKSTTDHIFSAKKDHAIILEHELNGRKVELERMMFDAPDPLFLSPHVLWYLAKCSRLRFIELLLAPVGYLWLFLCIYFHSEDPNTENNAMLSITKVMGQKWVDLFKKHNPIWKAQAYNYWVKRNEKEYYDFIVENY